MVKKTLCALLFGALWAMSASAQKYQFECITNSGLTGDTCDICPSTVVTSRSFNGLLIYRDSVPWKWIDQPYSVRVKPGNVLDFWEATPGPDRVTIALSRTSFSTIAGFRDSTFCNGETPRRNDVNIYNSNGDILAGTTRRVRLDSTAQLRVQYPTGNAAALFYGGTDSTATAGGAGIYSPSGNGKATVTDQKTQIAQGSAGNALTLQGDTISSSKRISYTYNLSGSMESTSLTPKVYVDSLVASGSSGTLNYIPKWSPDASHLSESHIFDTGDRIGVNTISPAAKFHVVGDTSGNGVTAVLLSGDLTGNSGVIRGTSNDYMFNPSADQVSDLFQSVSNLLRIEGAHNKYYIQAANNSISIDGAGTNDLIVAQKNDISSNVGGAVTAEYGVWSDLLNVSSTQNGAHYGTYNHVGGNVTNAYGFFSEIDSIGGYTPTNAYGLRLGNIKASGNRYSIYASDANGKTYLNGSTGIGTASPARKLEVNGEVRIDDLTTDAPTRIVGADADGDLNEITVGTGLDLTGGVLTTTGGGDNIYNSDGTIPSGTTRNVNIDATSSLWINYANGSPGALVYSGSDITSFDAFSDLASPDGVNQMFVSNSLVQINNVGNIITPGTTETTFSKKAGYTYNLSALLGSTSFTPKVYVDSLVAAGGGGGATNLTISGTSSPLTLNSDTGTDVTLTAGTGISLAGSSGNATITNSAPDQTVSITGAGINVATGTYPNFTVTGTEVDGSVTNELQTITNSSDATSHTVTLSNSGGSTQLVEGSGVTLTTTGTGSAGIVTIAATGDGTGVTTLNTLTDATQTFATGTSGSDFGISSATGTHTFNLPTASGSNRGALSSADWTTFNGKQAAGTYATQDGNTLAAALTLGTNDANALNLETNNVTRLSITGGASTGGAFTATDVTANTNSVETANTYKVNSSGTAAAGFGLRNLYQLESSTTDAQDAAAIDVLLTTATHASLTSAMIFSTRTGGGALAERLRIAGDGKIGIGTGTSTPATLLQVLGTTEQIRASYDASNYFSTTVSSAGIPTLDASGGQIKAADDFYSTGTLHAGTQVKVQASSVSPSRTYSLTNAGATVTPGFTHNEAGSTAGSKMMAMDYTNGVVFAIGNASSVWVARAGINTANLVNTAGSESGDLLFYTQSAGTSMAERWRIASTGAMSNTAGVGTAYLHLKAGTATANTAPLKFTSGTNLTAVENGTVEYDGTDYFASSGGTRYTLARTLAGSATLDFPSTNGFFDNDLTITVTGADDGDTVVLGVPNGSTNAQGFFTAWVSAADTVTVRFSCIKSGGAVNPASGTFKVKVLK